MEKGWNDDWRKDLEETNNECFKRLQNCKNTKNDLIIIARYIHLYNKKNFTKEECLDRAIEWVTGWNNQVELLPVNYDWYLQRI